MTVSGVHLGCPSWGFKDWVGQLYRRGSKAGDFLAQYAEVFNTVEGNTTFYSLPNAETVLRWRNATPETFRFAFKLPREITHRFGLVNAGALVQTFLDRLAPLGPRLGPVMVQLPASFGPDRLDVLDRFLANLPSEIQLAVEVRHLAFYEDPELTRSLDEMLSHWACERILLDTRSLRSGDAEHPDVVTARHKKPALPIRIAPLSPHPLVRFIGHPDAEVNEPWLAAWAEVVAGWIAEGRRPYFFTHCPNDFYAPPLARSFHRKLVALRPELEEMPTWPGEVEERTAGQQLSLFG